MRKSLFAAFTIGALILGVSGYVAAGDKPVRGTRKAKRSPSLSLTGMLL